MKLTKLPFLQILSIQRVGTFLIALSLFSMILDAQIKIKERVELGPQQPKTWAGKDSKTNMTEYGILLAHDSITGTSLTHVKQPIKYIAPSTINGDSMVVSIVATAVGGAVLSIDPTPVYPSYAVGNMHEGEYFFLQGGIQSAIVAAHFLWAPPNLIDYVVLVNGGSGFTVGDYPTDCFGTCCLTVRVTEVSPSSTCVIVNAERSPISIGDTVNLVFHQSYSPDQLFDIQLLASDSGGSCPPGNITVTKAWESFVVSMSRDTLKNREVAIDTVIAVDKDGKEVTIDPMTSVNLYFEENGQYVDFISAAGDTVDELTNVPYSVLRSGQIKIIARGTEGGGPVSASVSPPKRQTQIMRTASTLYETEFPKATVTATAISDATRTVSHDLVLVPEIKVIAVADSIKPRYSPYIDLVESRTDVKIAVTISGVILGTSLYQVEISSRTVEGYGGHAHTDNRPSGRFIEGSSEYTMIYGTTGDTIRARYQASLFGGLEYISAKLSGSTPAITDSDLVVVRVPNLQLLSEGVHYTKVGGTCNHHGPSDRGVVDSCQLQDNNHWGTGDLINAVQAISDSFAILYPNYRLRINDMSLRCGGGFDLNGGWDPDIEINCHSIGHCEHRLGTNADISYSAYKPTNQEEPLSPDELRDLLLMITQIYGKPYIHDNHYHLQ